MKANNLFSIMAIVMSAAACGPVPAVQPEHPDINGAVNKTGNPATAAPPQATVAAGVNRVAMGEVLAVLSPALSPSVPSKCELFVSNARPRIRQNVTWSECATFCAVQYAPQTRRDAHCDYTAAGASAPYVRTLKSKHRITRTPALLAGALTFNEVDYLAMNPDVAASGVKAQAHYRQFGQGELRSPNVCFDELFYVAINSDVNIARRRGLIESGFAHFRDWGLGERRTIFTRFDEVAYLLANPDVAVAVLMNKTLSSGLEHYVTYGRREGRGFRLSQEVSEF